ncbi:MAG: YggS family pyridoxal phosphate-dependent enzyme [Mucilaginibacter sp.]|uniref:YggS family pyridoxal phosphate-dependent enzyme n=1 Tax=Mucilaginibacter sp. TaxID=1882438 RepID=UPI0031A582E3
MEDQQIIIRNIEAVQRRIEKACVKAGRCPNEVTLLLATKTVPVEKILIALESGCGIIAENKVQEVREKYTSLAHSPHVNHFIGHLQSNKIKDLLKYNISCIQSIDNFELAEKLDQRLSITDRKMNIYIQVNTSDEESKYGVHPAEALSLIRQISLLKNVQITGLMTIGILSNESEKVRTCFKLLKNLQKQIIEANIPNVSVRELSMGMSGDLEIAIEEGATTIRVGTAIFGQRPTPDSYYWTEYESHNTQ